MDNTIFFERFGLNPSNFVNRHYEKISNDEGLIYEAEEEYRKHICPYCNSFFMNIHSRRWITRNLSSSICLKEELRIKRIRYICPSCKKTYTFPLEGLPRNKNITEQMIKAIQLEFYNIQSFSDIAKRYNVSVQTVINIFDKSTEIVPRKELPQYLCIDEKHFEGDTNGKYCVVLSNFYTGEVIDILPNRQMPYLDEYFSNISLRERNNVKVFISDMYDGYVTVKNTYFPKAMFVVDLFHVIKLLTAALNKIRIRTYNQCALEDTVERHFMKTNWRFFLMDHMKIHKNEYHSKKFDIYMSYGEIIIRCLKLNQVFWDGYHALQELLHYDKYETYTEAEKFMNRTIAKLSSSGDELLEKVAASYKKWKVGIIHGLARNQTGKRFSNAIAENNNSHIQRVIDVSYGYRNFKRFRARAMLILTYKRAKVVPYW